MDWESEYRKYNERVDQILLAGGISQEEVIDGVAQVPAGWTCDFWTGYFVPPNFHFNESVVKN